MFYLEYINSKGHCVIDARSKKYHDLDNIIHNLLFNGFTIRVIYREVE